jgi:hypothetical protein
VTVTSSRGPPRGSRGWLAARRSPPLRGGGADSVGHTLHLAGQQGEHDLSQLRLSEELMTPLVLLPISCWKRSTGIVVLRGLHRCLSNRTCVRVLRKFLLTDLMALGSSPDHLSENASRRLLPLAVDPRGEKHRALPVVPLADGHPRGIDEEEAIAPSDAALSVVSDLLVDSLEGPAHRARGDAGIGERPGDRAALPGRRS